MTVATTASTIGYTGNAVTVDFQVPFPFVEANDLLVKLDGTTLFLGVDYTVAGAGGNSGTITTTDPVPDASALTIERITDITQSTTFSPQGPFSPKRHEAAYDKLTVICQDIARDVAGLKASTIGGAYTAYQLQVTFTLDDPLESNFPIDVPAGLIAGTCVLGRVENLTTPAELLDDPPSIQWTQVSDANISLTRVSGLTIGQTYRLTFEVRGVGG